MAQFNAYKLYREKLDKRIEANEPVMPSIDIIVRDFTLADENPNYVDEQKKFVNFDKCMWFATYMNKIKRMRKIGYPLNHSEETLRDRNIRRFFIDPLKGAALPTETDLYELSQKWEPRSSTKLM